MSPFLEGRAARRALGFIAREMGQPRLEFVRAASTSIHSAGQAQRSTPDLQYFDDASWTS
ncbi:MAG: hypothetical protein JOY67_16095 [Hyphomicrobiales bacterium]|nr:hypothetical protein [Hyphomicrobiales bacterium]